MATIDKTNQATKDAKAIYRTAAGKRYFEYLMNEACVGGVISNKDRDGEQKALGAHNFIVEKLCKKLEKKGKS